MPGTVVIGVGNTILSDEGAGMHLLERLRQRWTYSPSVTFHAAGTGGLHVADVMAGHASAIFLDIIAADQPPGTVMVLDKQALLRPGPSGELAGHAVGLNKAIEFATLTGELPDQLFLVAIVPAVIAFGERLSGQVGAAMEEYERAALVLIQSLGITVNINKGAVAYGAE